MSSSVSRVEIRPGAARRLRWAFVLLFALALGACGGSGNQPGTSEPTLQATAPSTATPSPTPAPRRVLLVAPQAADDDLVQHLLQAVESHAAQDGLIVEQAETLPVQLESNYALVLMVHPDEAFLDAARANPGLAFVAIGGLDLPTETNLWVIGNAGMGMDAAAFLSGYVAAMVTTEWRIGAVETYDQQSGHQLDRAFVNGGIFFCGLCRPQYPPYYSYPAILAANEITEGSAAQVLVTAEEMGLGSLWVPAEMAHLFGSLQLPPRLLLLGPLKPAGLPESAWIATVRPAPELRLAELWGAILSGGQAEDVSIPVVLEDVNAAVLSPGRLHLAEQVRDELTAGFIETGSGE